ncbi:maestro heat-like repeat-containing protein family member 2B-like [Platysternon megacephalum]|uniref:Maestro heat-like repeat-containing protein family member 2B-like n=1 Tax=Platysternon megacephalum TaxID=55544 RepID=A0A4D9DQC5_9SAUR|nr:maestro heat-like repeat-containing protein family member 2B-like [Platysternon megacephalum]
MVCLASPLQPAGEVTPKGLARGQENRATGQQTPTVLGRRQQGDGRGTVLKTSLAPLSTAIGVQPRVSESACSHLGFRTYTQHHAAATREVRCGNMAWEGVRGRERETG